jgi:hypothetical protein
MPPTKKSRGNQANRFSQQLADFSRRFHQTVEANRRQQRLRRQRQQLQRADPTEEQQRLALRRSAQVRWLQRRLQRSPRDPQQSWSAIAWLWPRSGEELSTREAAALLLRHCAAALLLLILFSLALNAIPLKLASPNWYLQLFAYIAENVPVLFLASGFAMLSLVLRGTNDRSIAYHATLLRLSRLGYIVALVLLPLQLGFTALLLGQTYSTQRTQRAAIRANADALIAGAQQTNTSEQFIAYLRSRNLSGNLESIAAAPLVQVKTEFIRSVEVNQQQQEQRLGAEIRSTLLRYVTNSLKLFITLFLLAGFMRIFQALVRRCSLDWMSNEQPSELPADASLPQVP